MKNSYKICTRCVMDTSDPEITFDLQGVCNHCHYFDLEVKKRWYPNEEGKIKLEKIIEKIKKSKSTANYDCIIGLSGGVDSSYLAMLIKDWGLRPLVVHIDAGWNSELAVSNIEAIIKHCGYDFYTHVVDWEDMKNLQLAFLKSGVPNQDVPQDHVFFANLYYLAAKNKIKYIFSGGNIATESIFPNAWMSGSAMDSRNLKAIYKKFSKKKLRSYRMVSFFQYYFWYPFVKGIRVIRPLNYMIYNKEQAVSFLMENTTWRPYQFKHGESLFTKFFQNFYLIKRFGYDKRRPHFSSLIMSGQLTRQSAISMLNEPTYEKNDLDQDIDFFCKKLSITKEELDELMIIPIRSHVEFKNWDSMHKFVKKIQSFVSRVFSFSVNIYS